MLLLRGIFTAEFFGVERGEGEKAGLLFVMNVSSKRVDYGRHVNNYRPFSWLHVDSFCSALEIIGQPKVWASGLSLQIGSVGLVALKVPIVGPALASPTTGPEKRQLCCLDQLENKRCHHKKLFAPQLSTYQQPCQVRSVLIYYYILLR